MVSSDDEQAQDQDKEASNSSTARRCLVNTTCWVTTFEDECCEQAGAPLQPQLFLYLPLPSCQLPLPSATFLPPSCAFGHLPQPSYHHPATFLYLRPPSGHLPATFLHLPATFRPPSSTFLPPSYHLPPSSTNLLYLPPPSCHLPAPSYAFLPPSCHRPPTSCHLPAASLHLPPPSYHLPAPSYAFLHLAATRRCIPTCGSQPIKMGMAGVRQLVQGAVSRHAG